MSFWVHIKGRPGITSAEKCNHSCWCFIRLLAAMVSGFFFFFKSFSSLRHYSPFDLKVEKKKVLLKRVHTQSCILNRVRLFAVPWTVARQTPLPWDFLSKNTVATLWPNLHFNGLLCSSGGGSRREMEEMDDYLFCLDSRSRESGLV